MTLLLVLSILVQNSFQFALPGFLFEFPRDHGNHPSYKLEWWYWTGHLQTEEGRFFGFQLTFFRVGVRRNVPSPSNWALEDLYPAHFAVSDLEGERFLHFQKLSRSSPGVAGAEVGSRNVWNQAWKAFSDGPSWILKADAARAGIDLELKTLKAPVVHGHDGISQKGDAPGQASHYYSLTRLEASGQLRLEEKTYRVTGVAWMDHEFGTTQLSEEQTGWDWFAIQLDNETELMLYLLRRRDGSIDPNSSGTMVDADGRAIRLQRDDFSVRTTRTWESPESGIRYPVDSAITIPSLGCRLQLRALLDAQELDARDSTRVIYWEGATSVRGECGNSPVQGRAYVERTGYGSGGRPDI